MGEEGADLPGGLGLLPERPVAHGKVPGQETGACHQGDGQDQGQGGQGPVASRPAHRQVAQARWDRLHRPAPEELAQILGQGQGGIVALAGSLFQAAHDDGLQVPGNLGIAFSDRQGPLLLDPVQEVGDGAPGGDRQAAGENLVEGGPQTVDVAAGVQDAAAGLLGAHIGGGPGQVAVQGYVLPLLGEGQAEIREHPPGPLVLIPGDQDVGWLDVPVDHANPVHGVQAQGQPLHELGRDAVGQVPAGLAQGGAFKKLDGQVGEVLHLADLVDLGHMGMVHPGLGLGFPEELAEVLLALAISGFRAVERNELEGDDAPQPGIEDLEDGAHGASPQEGQGFVAGPAGHGVAGRDFAAGLQVKVQGQGGAFPSPLQVERLRVRIQPPGRAGRRALPTQAIAAAQPFVFQGFPGVPGEHALRQGVLQDPQGLVLRDANQGPVAEPFLGPDLLRLGQEPQGGGPLKDPRMLTHTGPRDSLP